MEEIKINPFYYLCCLSKMEKNDLLIVLTISILIVTIIGILAIPIFMLVDRWHTIPYAKMNYQKNCPDKIWFSGNTIYSPTMENLGDSTGIFQQCISSKHLLIDGLPEACTNVFRLEKFTGFTTHIANPRWSISLQKDFSKTTQEISFEAIIYCKQKIWFLDRSCDSESYKCKYIKKKDWFELIK